MLSTKWCFVAVAVVGIAGPAWAIVLIDPDTNNGSFEMAGGVINVEKIQEWDGAVDIDFWTEWTGVSGAMGDSGIEMTGNASDGDMVSFLQPNNAVYNLTSHVAQEGDNFFFSWDHVLRNSLHTVGLVWDDGGTITSIAASEISSDTAGTSNSNSFTVQAGDPWIGSTIGLGLVNNNSNYPEVDNFILTANEAAAVPGDVDGDGDVDLVDYGFIRDNFRLSPATKEQGDITGANIVDLNDFLLWRSNHPFPAAGSAEIAAGDQAIPEPNSWLLASLTGLAVIYRRSRT